MRHNNRFFRYCRLSRYIAGVAVIAVTASVITCTSAPKPPPQSPQYQETFESAQPAPAIIEKKGIKSIFSELFGGKKDNTQKAAESVAKKATSAQTKAQKAAETTAKKAASAQAKAKRLAQKAKLSAEKKAQKEKLAASLNMLDEYAIEKNDVKLQNPVLLVHAEGVRDTIFEQNMWGALPQTVTGAGVNVYFAGTDSWGTIESNGEIIKEAVAKISKIEGGKKINIVAFGKGGLDARYAINTFGADGASRIASLSTIATAHRGVKALDTVRKIPEPLKTAFAFFVNTAAKVQGDKAPDFLHSQKQLTESVCTKFNADFPNRNTVLYISYFSMPKYAFLDTKALFLSPLLRAAENDANNTNNGFCSLSSAKWGNYKGTVRTNVAGALSANTFALVLNNIQKAGF